MPVRIDGRLDLPVGDAALDLGRLDNALGQFARFAVSSGEAHNHGVVVCLGTTKGPPGSGGPLGGVAGRGI